MNSALKSTLQSLSFLGSELDVVSENSKRICSFKYIIIDRTFFSQDICLFYGGCYDSLSARQDETKQSRSSSQPVFIDLGTGRFWYSAASLVLSFPPQLSWICACAKYSFEGLFTHLLRSNGYFFFSFSFFFCCY